MHPCALRLERHERLPLRRHAVERPHVEARQLVLREIHPAELPVLANVAHDVDQLERDAERLSALRLVGALWFWLGTHLLPILRAGTRADQATRLLGLAGLVLAAVPALRPDVSIIHAQQADADGNVQLWGISGVQKEVVLAAQRSIVTVEEIVARLEPRPGSVFLPSWVISAVAVVPGGAHPSYAHGYYDRDNGFYRRWDAISRDRDLFDRWLQSHVYGTSDVAGYHRAVERERASA